MIDRWTVHFFNEQAYVACPLAQLNRPVAEGYVRGKTVGDCAELVKLGSCLGCCACKSLDEKNPSY